eukprot:626615-Prymnesium_polylepis.1
MSDAGSRGGRAEAGGPGAAQSAAPFWPLFANFVVFLAHRQEGRKCRKRRDMCEMLLEKAKQQPPPPRVHTQ